MKKSHRRNAGSQSYHPLTFGGWHDYQTWADHDFVPRPAEAPAAEPATVEQGTPEDAVSSDNAAASENTAPEENAVDENPGRAVRTEDTPRLPIDGDDYWDSYPDDGPATTMARPYVRTGGRAGTTYDLRLETMLSTTRMGAARLTEPAMTIDHQLICELCRAPTSVAEIAAHLQAPLGVARVLIGDALTAHLLTLHEVAREADGRPTVELMRRVYDGLRRLA
jgi:hypothetical protein